MKDYSYPAVIPYRSFNPYAQGEVDLRGSGVMVGDEIKGISPESNGLQDVVARARQFAGAFMHLGTGDMVQLIYHRLPALVPPARTFPTNAAELVDAEQRAQFTAESHWYTPKRLYLTHQYEPTIRGAIRATLFAATGPQRQTRHELLREFALNRFAAFENAASTAVGLRRMSSVETFRDLMMDVTYHDYPALLPDDTIRLNEVLGCEYFLGGIEPYINGYHLRPVVITHYPTVTVPQILAVLLRHPGRMLVSARFICNDAYDAQRMLKDERQHWHRELIGSVWAVVKSWFGAKNKIDYDAQQQLANIDLAIAAAAAGTGYGHATITAIIRDPDPQRADLRADNILKDCHALGIMARLEDVNAPEAIFGSLPGNGEANVRKPIISNHNFADVTLPVEHWTGLPYIDSPYFPPNTPSPMVCSGTGREPFYWPTHINGVGNQLIIGPVGSGKSSLLGALVSAYTGIPDARIVWLDLDYSSFVLAHLMGADYRDIGSDTSPPINPLAFLDQPGGLEYLYGWFERLFKRWNFELGEREFEDFTEALRKARDTGIRSLVGLRALIYGDMGGRGRIRRILQHYCTYWGHIFNAESAVPDSTLPPLSVFELRGLMAYGTRCSAPAIELVLQSVISRLNGTSPCWILVDEAWALLSDEVSAEWLFDSIRTFRKKNAAVVLSTQSLTEIVGSPYRALLLESCPGKVFLPNAEARGAYVAKMYMDLGLNEHECSIIANASPRRDYFFKSAIGARLFSLALGDTAKALVAATGYQDVQMARKMMNEGSFNVDGWLKSRRVAV